MTPRPQLLPSSPRHVYLTMPGSIVNYCGGPAAVLAPYHRLEARVGRPIAAMADTLATPDFVATRAATNAILLFLTPGVIVSQ